MGIGLKNKNMRKIEIDLDDILELVNCAEDYGFANDVLLNAFASFTVEVTDEEIKSYATKLMEEDGYGQEDYDEAIEVLTTWRDRFKNNKK